MLHDGTVSYLAPSTCISRDDEVAHRKKDKDFLVVESNGVRVQRRDTDILVDVHTEAKLQQALTRRGLALDRVNVVSFAVHDRIMRYFFHVSAQPVPQGFVSPGIAGVIRADKELWLQVGCAGSPFSGSGHAESAHLGPGDLPPDAAPGRSRWCAQWVRHAASAPAS